MKACRDCKFYFSNDVCGHSLSLNDNEYNFVNGKKFGCYSHVNDMRKGLCGLEAILFEEKIKYKFIKNLCIFIQNELLILYVCFVKLKEFIK